jgi:hypothetical protein
MAGNQIWERCWIGGAQSTDTPDINWVDHTDRLRAQMLRAQLRFKKYADRNRTERSFEVGEQVLLKLQPYAQTSVTNRPCRKLTYKFFGPFPVEQRIGELAYKLTLPEDARIHPVFHVSQLKPFTPNYSPVFMDLPRPFSSTGLTTYTSPGTTHAQTRSRVCGATQDSVVVSATRGGNVGGL